MTLERSTIFGFREEKDKYSMRKHGSCSSFDRQSFDHSGHSLFGVESVASDTDGSPIKDKDGVRPAELLGHSKGGAHAITMGDLFGTIRSQNCELEESGNNGIRIHLTSAVKTDV